MKYAIPEISWHNRDPVLSVDFQPKRAEGEPLRLATGGADTHVVIWYITTSDTGSVQLEVAADLTRHQKAVNVVRWSPSGELLASGDDESIIFVWKQKNEESVPVEGEEQYKESWVIYKTLRGHMEDVLDISWSANSLQLASGSVDNKLILWDVTRGRYTNILADHKGFVQGVTWDPLGQMVVTASSDRVLRTFDLASKKVCARSSKAAVWLPPGHPLHTDTGALARLFADDTLQSYYRRGWFSPCGALLAAPAGRLEPEHAAARLKPLHALYIYTRHCLNTPACVLPCGEAALVTRWSPRAYRVRDEGPAPWYPAGGRRLVLAVGTVRCVVLYDTQQRTPIALVNNIHYTRLTDLTWSCDGRVLVASSTDGFCSVITFAPGELGDPLPDTHTPAHTHTHTPDHTVPAAQESMEIEEEPKNQKEAKENEAKPTTPPKPEPKSTTRKIDSYIKFKTPSEKHGKAEKSPTKRQKITGKQQKTPVKIDLLVETAMPSWSDNSNSEVMKPKEETQPQIEIMEIEDSEDIKLVYEDTQDTQKDSTEATKDSKEDKSLKTNSPEIKKVSPKTNIPSSNSPEIKKVSPKVNSPSSDNNFLKQAKVTDVKEPAVKAVPSPKAPRRVNFVTLSSPKNKKKC